MLVEKPWTPKPTPASERDPIVTTQPDAELETTEAASDSPTMEPEAPLPWPSSSVPSDSRPQESPLPNVDGGYIPPAVLPSASPSITSAGPVQGIDMDEGIRVPSPVAMTQPSPYSTQEPRQTFASNIDYPLPITTGETGVSVGTSTMVKLLSALPS